MKLPRSIVPVALALLSAACSEQLTAPGDCPGNCPSDHLVMRDTVIFAERDSSYDGFVTASQGTRLLLSDGFGGSQSIGIVRFAPVFDSISFQGKFYAAARDSIFLSVTVLARDPATTGLSLEVYRLPSTLTVDSSTSYAEVDPLLTADRLLGTLTVPDTLTSGTLRLAFLGSDMAKVAFAPADSNILKLAYRLTSAAPTGIAIGSGAAGTAEPGFLTWLRATVPDTTGGDTTIVQGLPRIVLFSSSVGDAAATPPAPDLLTVGGIPSSRSIIRFAVPPQITDTGSIVRATLVLVPNEPVTALPGDSALLDVEGVYSDLGPKSPRIQTLDAYITTRVITAGEADSIMMDVTNVARLWNEAAGIPPSLIVAMLPEASTFGLVRFGSSRTPGRRPAIRITYASPYPFEVQ
jgi:hypothetical protein